MMKIRDITPKDEKVFVRMQQKFYDSPACLHPVALSVSIENFRHALHKPQLCRLLMFEQQDHAIGYAFLTFSYSGEVGGLQVWLEELFVEKEHRGGVGKQFLEWMLEQYRGKAKRFRLEAAPENVKAQKLYQTFGFQDLPYQQMALDTGEDA